MKPAVLYFSAFFAAVPLLHADDVALLTFRVAKDQPLQNVALEFYGSDAPAHVANFKKLAEKGFYKGVTVHRVFPHTLVQMGDPLSKKKDRSLVGTGGPGFTLPAEIHRKHMKGAVAAARLPDKINPSRVSNGSQFYICLEPMANLDGQYTVFGQVLSGFSVLDSFSTKPVDSNDNPLEPIVLQSVKIVPREALPSYLAPAKAGKPRAEKRWWQIFG